MILAIINAKGGTAKTTTAVNLAAAFAAKKRKTLLIDLDSQASASLSLGIPRAELDPSIAAAILNGHDLADVIRPSGIDRLDLVTGSADLVDVDLQLASAKGRERRLADAIASVRDRYDFIVLDCPPSLSLVPVNALIAADAFIVPTPPEYLALEGLIGLMVAVDRIRAGIGSHCPMFGILLTKVDRRRRVTDEIIRLIRSHYGKDVFKTEIKTDVRLIEAPSFGQTIQDYAPKSSGAEGYKQLADEIIRRKGHHE